MADDAEDGAASRRSTDRSESALISRVVVGDDHDAFAELVRLHQSAVRQFLRRLTGSNWDRADDLAQDTFWKAYRHLATFQGRGRFLSWLFGIAYQLFITDLRRARGEMFVPLEEDLAIDVDASQRFAEARTFDELMTMLRPEERATLVLHYRHELTHVEIADTLSLPIGTVKTLIRRARLRLKAAHETARRRVNHE
jgi:RNA polymerase sigma-70 factor (ECF subfamily)